MLNIVTDGDSIFCGSSMLSCEHFKKAVLGHCSSITVCFLAQNLLNRAGKTVIVVTSAKLTNTLLEKMAASVFCLFFLVNF